MRLHLGGLLPFYIKTKQENIEVNLKAPAPLSEVLSQLGIPTSEVYLTVINGELTALDQAVVNDTDEVRVYPPIDGG